MLLLVRDDKFLKCNNHYYNVGSSSNELYANNIYSMGEFYNLSWVMPANNKQVEGHEELSEFSDMHLILNDKHLGFFAKCRIIKKYVKKSDVVVAKMSLFQAIIASHYAVKYNKVLVIESASDLFAALWFHGGNIKYKLAAIPLDMFVKYYHRKANYIVYVSKEFMQKKYKSEAKSIGCADVVLDNPKKVELDKRIKKIQNYTEEHVFIIGLIGATQAEYRGHDVLIKSCAPLIKKGFRIIIKFLGGGTADYKRKKCADNNNIGENVEFCGRLKHDEVAEWLTNIDILVMPTKVESLGRAVLEAMSVACPVIGSRTTALRELLPESCLVDPTDTKAITSLIEKMIIDNEYMIECAKANFEKSREYSSAVTNEIRREFYQKIIDDMENR